MTFHQANAQFITNNASNLIVFKFLCVLRRQVRSANRQMAPLPRGLHAN